MNSTTAVKEIARKNAPIYWGNQYERIASLVTDNKIDQAVAEYESMIVSTTNRADVRQSTSWGK